MAESSSSNTGFQGVDTGLVPSEPVKDTGLSAADNQRGAPKVEAAPLDPASGGQGGIRGASQLARDEVSKLVGQAGDQARSFVDTGKERASGALDEFSTLMRDAAVSVDEKLGEQYGAYARSAADQISGFAESLRGKQVDDLVDDAREFVKKSPAVAVGIAAGVGFVLARLLRSGLDAANDSADKGGSESGGRSGGTNA